MQMRYLRESLGISKMKPCDTTWFGENSSKKLWNLLFGPDAAKSITQLKKPLYKS
jgi:hypothetical protein